MSGDSEGGVTAGVTIRELAARTVAAVGSPILVESPTGNGPFQGKAIGENPISPVAPAIANAVEDAVGVRITNLPITPEKVLAGLRAKTK